MGIGLRPAIAVTVTSIYSSENPPPLTKREKTRARRGGKTPFFHHTVMAYWGRRGVWLAGAIMHDVVGWSEVGGVRS